MGLNLDLRSGFSFRIWFGCQSGSDLSTGIDLKIGVRMGMGMAMGVGVGTSTGTGIGVGMGTISSKIITVLTRYRPIVLELI